MPDPALIVIGASLGGIEALITLVRGLRADFPAALAIVQHVPAGDQSHLPEILAKAGHLPVSRARDGEPIRGGHVYVAPNDWHLLIAPGRLKLSRSARENRFRPAIDPLFRSAARTYGARVIGVLLSGGLDDGVAGLLAIRSAGGVAIVQDPADALLSILPRNAINISGADYVVPVAQMTELLDQLVRAPAVTRGEQKPMDPIDQMPAAVDRDMEAQERNERLGTSSVYSCPECGGVLWQVDQQEIVRFRCHVGHAYYGEQLLEDQADALEAALWTAVRTFRERSTLSRHLALTEQSKGNTESAARYEETASLADRHGDVIRKFLLDPQAGLFPPGNGE
jgi:two-component system chemotaxis response regulator CheB